MASNNNTSDATSNGTSPNTNAPIYFHSSTELADLGRERFDHDTAAISDRDFALYSRGPVAVRTGHAPEGLEEQVFGWTTFHYTTAERNNREELKGDLHEGQLHRQNRAARDGSQSVPMMGNGAGGGGLRAGRNGREGKGGNSMTDALCAGRKPDGHVPPLAKGFAEEMDKTMFWDEPIV
ncbi:hypothetical protein BKA66DRAFT_424098 [Pyrenochaeta sp. MPI-SDFR-AT-0127]|nr:hypothetical protein BKA66DRAFT_424098 [Pyrenochaeta sp. MPI-SDFR-AT-0127]